MARSTTAGPVTARRSCCFIRSRATPRCTSRSARVWPWPGQNLIRVSTGLEDGDDVIRDMTRALDALRRREPAEPREDIESLHANEADPHYDPADLLNHLQRGSAVRAAVETLKPQARQLVALAFFRGMTQQEIADTCGLPLGTVKATLFRAYQQLRDCLVSRGFGAGA